MKKKRKENKVAWNWLGELLMYSKNPRVPIYGRCRAKWKYKVNTKALISLPVNAAVWLEERSELVKKQAQIMGRIYGRTDAKQN